MSPALRSPAAVLACLALLASSPTAAPSAAAAPAQDKSLHEDAQFGFKFRPPKEWTRIPLKLEERWQVAKYLSDRTYFYTDKNNGWTHEHKPQLLVIAFVTDIVRAETTVKKEKKEGEDRITILFSNPYKDYLDYLKRTYSGGGYYVSDEQETTIDGIGVTQYEIKVEKLVRDGPKRIVCWVFHTPEVDFAVQFEVLEDSWAKLKKPVGDCLRSFKLIPRTDGGLPTASTGEQRIFEFDETEKMTPEQRKERRQQLERSLHDKAREGATEGWLVQKIGRFLILNHCDEKLAKRKADQAEAVFKWLETTFSFVGPQEYVRQPILRICKDWDEERSYRTGSDAWGGVGIEIVTHNDQEGRLGFETQYLNMRVLQIWFQERDRDLYWAFPSWLDYGLVQVVGPALGDRGGKLDFRMDDWARDNLRERARDRKLTKPRELLRMGVESFHETQDFGMVHEAGALVRFFVCGAASSNPRTKDVLKDYIRNLKAVVAEIKAEEQGQGSQAAAKPKTEAEEEEAFKRERSAWKEKEKRLIDAAFERTFRGWTEKEWAEFETVYYKSMS